MQNRLFLFFLSFVLFLFVACQKEDNIYLTLDGQAQGTTFHIVYQDAADRDFSQSMDSLFRLMDSSMSLWDSNSTISRINRNEADVPLDKHIIKVFDEAHVISVATQGALDITIGPLVNAWKIGTKDNSALPDATTIDSILSFTGYHKVSIVNDRLHKQDPRIQLDFNAIAQGYTVDLISTFLELRGIESYLVEVGGEVRAKGVNSRNKHWQIGIDKPVDSPSDERPLQTAISIDNQSLATSGSYRKYKEKDGQKYSHVINPTSGYPANQTLLSVSVIAKDCTTADGYATAFLVMGLDGAMQFATKNKIPIYCIYAEDGQLVVKATPDFPN